MDWKLYKRLNVAGAWLVFALSSLVYLLTISHSANLWDTSEFVVCVNKLEVGHPPGSPFFMLVYNLATQFTSDPMQVATLCNVTSALLSGFTIFFLFLTITHLARRLVAPGCKAGALSDGTNDEPLTLAKGIGILFAGLGGAMLYAFTDTFWYSAIEAEVYAFSSFFTALVFWLMLEWEERSENENSDKWLVLIAYFFGLSIGVHLLNLLCLPAMALVFYFRRAKKPTVKGFIITILISFVLIAVLMFGVIQGSMKVASWFDIFTVNTLGLPFNSGLITYLVILIALAVVSLVSMHLKGATTLAKSSVFVTLFLLGIPFISSSVFLWILLTVVLAYLVFGYKKLTLRMLYGVQLATVCLMIGYSCYGVIIIRSAAMPPMNENNPSTPITLKKYLTREQYGAVPLFKGQTFASRPIEQTEKQGSWGPAPKSSSNDKDRYVRGQKEFTYKYDNEILFPRVYSNQPNHVAGYNMWMGRDVNDHSQPSFTQNLKYFFKYQVNFMYWRYFGWNFIGRQNDIQGHGTLTKGGVSTGFNFIDRIYYGDAKYYPVEMAQNKGHNVYYLMPLILGLLGIAFQLFSRGQRGTQSFWIVFFFFFMTGLAIIFYINQTPYQPRERDYAYAGSFYAFAIWIGVGIMAIWHWIANKNYKYQPIATFVAGVIAVAVPLQMLAQNFDDHDRSGRTVAADLGYNYLMSCEDNAIVFCFGDNDTFPLWYAQEIEHIKLDTRACNLSYLAAEWYVDQMRMQAYKSQPLPFKLMVPEFYYPVVAVGVADGGPMELGKALDMVPKTQSQGYQILPTNQLFLSIDSVAIQKQFPGLRAEVNPQMLISLKGKNYLGRDGLAVLDLIRTNNWQRPIYWLKSTPGDAFSNLNDYFGSSGAAWKLYPTNMKGQNDSLLVNREYDLVMKTFRWFGANGKNTYFDDNIRNNIISLYRAQVFPSLALRLIDLNDKTRAQAVLKRCAEVLPNTNLPYTYSDLNLALACYHADLPELGDTIVRDNLSSIMQGFQWFLHLSDRLKRRVIAEGEIEQLTDRAMDAMGIVANANRKTQFATEVKAFNQLLKTLYGVDPNFTQPEQSIEKQ